MRREGMTGYHAVAWKEPMIYQMERKGRRGAAIPAVEKDIKAAVGDVTSHIPERMKKGASEPS